MYNANYMDGVPVKIAEKFKPPPPIYNLPQPLANKINLDDNFYWDCPAFSCDFELEKKVLLKIEQWKCIRQRNKEQRNERALRREHQRKQDYEDSQKKLLCSVSYPSTDDLSSEEEEVEKNKEIKENGMNISGLNKTSPQACLTETVNSFHNILQPTVLSFNSNTTAYKPITPINRSICDNKISNSFNYKDFEEDTSSPFDNIELKTINDLDVLAQVLHNTQIKSSANEISNENNVKPLNDCSHNKVSEICYPDAQLKVENIPKSNKNFPRFSNKLNSTPGDLKNLRDHRAVWPHSSVSSYQMFNSLNYSNQSNHCKSNAHNIESEISHPYHIQQHLIDDHITKSKSVPDILKELRDEIRKSEIRCRNYSCNMADASISNNDGLTKCVVVSEGNAENSDVFSQLDIKEKELIMQISAMGFPLNRVARIVQLMGVDDKKVLEHLITLSELADLGFEESKISDALIRHENDKNKALDDLIS